MPRTRTVSDDHIFAAIQQLLQTGGDRAVTFSTVAAASGLAPPTLVQRFGNREGMVRVARLASWAALEERTRTAIAVSADKGPQGLLKAIGPVDPVALAADFRDPDLAQRAAAWRATIEAALALRLGSGAKGKESAALLFAAWQGHALWSGTGESAFRLKAAIKRLT